MARRLCLNIPRHQFSEAFHMSHDVLITFCTCPDEEVAEGIARTLVGERLAACVNLIPVVSSIYRWEGKIEHDTETLLLIKTTETRFDALSARLREMHPYDLPEIIASPVQRGLPDYLQWVSKCTEDDA
jgi:periplasmic divalent cation tolerance protein